MTTVIIGAAPTEALGQIGPHSMSGELSDMPGIVDPQEVFLERFRAEEAALWEAMGMSENASRRQQLAYRRARVRLRIRLHRAMRSAAW